LKILPKWPTSFGEGDIYAKRPAFPQDYS
jgi:hypothetical protein